MERKFWTKAGNRLVIFSTLLALWLLLTGRITASNILIGLVVSYMVACTFSISWTSHPYKFLQWRRFTWFLYFIAVFSWECLKANLDVAYRVLHPKMPVNPGIIKVMTTCTTEVSITFLSNFITLTPGTITVDTDIKNGILYIHWINISTRDVELTYRRKVYKFERIIKEVFE